MFVNSAISNLIRENKIAMIEQVIETSKGSGMITRNKSIQMLFDRGFINAQTAREYSFDVGTTEQAPGQQAPSYMNPNRR